MKIDFVLFDAGGTLIGTNTESEHWYEQFFVDACAEQGCHVTVAQVHEVLKRAARCRQFDSRCSSDKQSRAFWHHIYTTAFGDLLGAKSCTFTPAVIEHLAAEYIDRFEAGEFIRLFPDTLPALEGLASGGKRLGIVSNFGSYLTSFLERLSINQYFEFVLVSAIEGCEKPQPAIFERAATRCAVSPSQILFVGDHPQEDYEPATAAGMNAVLIDRHNRHASNERLRRIRRLEELSGILQAD